ncbi:MAG: Choline-sulfatase [uncultured Nocardioides sp.]|uniref:Choline-sulfatase n=1 Tax=uncultured Nocardioides sp. TaxID=198441 RepID=A0A6J4NC52_9ACTN|nr:MAG: Choline-sulfatase [uncultured Nocardioides sp.]
MRERGGSDTNDGGHVRHLRGALAGLCLLAVTAGGAAAAAAGTPGPGRATQDTPGATAAGVRGLPAAARAARPNIVLVVVDDLSLDLVQTMRTPQVMRRTGASYSHAFVTDSLCCVSRASLFTGQYPHQTGVRTNTSNEGRSSLGGWPAFAAGGNLERSFNVRLQDAGYATGFVGKYLNEYEWVPGRALPPVPPGWSDFNVVFGSAYDGWGFASTELDDGRLTIRDHPAPPASASAAEKDAAYAGTVIEDLALDFIRDREAGGTPYLLQVAAYAPHNRTNPEGHYPGDPLFPPMFRDREGERSCGRVACGRLTAADLPGFGDDRRDNRPRRRDGTPARAWNTAGGLSAADAVRDLRDRARMAQSVDRLVSRVLRTVGDDTYVVLTSDNGFHLGQLGMGRGKGTPYDTDVRVPLLVVGPGVVPGTRREVTSNIDLAPTFEELAGLKPAAYRSGTSLVPTFGDRGLVRRRHAFFEHTQQTLTGNDPDAAFGGTEMERIPSYTAVRSRSGLLVRFDLDPRRRKESWGYEFYSYQRDRFEKRNAFAAPRHRAEVRGLLARLKGFDGCRQTGDQRVPQSCRDLAR